MLEIQRIKKFLAPYLAALRNIKQRAMLPMYLQGLIAFGERKSMEPIAKRMDVNYDRLHHFITESTFDHAELQEIMVAQVLEHTAGKKVKVTIDDTSLPKSGDRSPFTAPNYSGQLGKIANCQTMVTATLTCGGVPHLLGMDLFMPQSWVGDTYRLDKARVPEECREPLSKPEMAAAMLRRFKKQGVPTDEILFDTGYCKSPQLRKAVSEMGGCYTGGIDPRHKVYPADLEFVEIEYKGRGRPHTRMMPKTAPVSIQTALAEALWKKIEYRIGTKGPLHGEYAAIRIRLADGNQVKFPDGRRHRLPGEEVVWLIVERRPNGELRYYISNKPADTDLESLVECITERWWCEQAHQQTKEELGLDHFEGRTWNGLHRHMLMVMMAFNFLQFLRHECTVSAEGAIQINPADSKAAGNGSAAAASRTSGKGQTAAADPACQAGSKAGPAPVKCSTGQAGAGMPSRTPEADAHSKHDTGSPANSHVKNKMPTLPQVRNLIAAAIAQALLPDIECPHCKNIVALSLMNVKLSCSAY